ncbi:hypothetical protein M3Y97_00412200 [Aphelenchoides bicaudatus]|nr:hypothetical protein M3Y97_00412200 [Aphelenchoides bicaudatus]
MNMEKQAIGQNVTRNKFRFFILVLATACLMIVFSCMISINFTVVCMDPTRGNNASEEIEYKHPVYILNQTQKTYIQWTVSIASMIATLPFIWLCNQYGAKFVFFTSGIVAAISTALIPIALSFGFNWFLAVRVFQGLSYACDFAVIGVLVTRWASLAENAKFIALMTCFSPLANTFTNAISGYVCDSFLGWPYVHYIHALVCLILFTLWFIFYNDDPRTNIFVSSVELAIIHEGKSKSHKEHSSFVPYKAIVTNKVVWAVWLNALCDLFSGFFLFIYAPTYTKKVLGMTNTETGIVGALGSLSHVPVKLICGYVSDTYNCIPERKKMQIFNSVAVLTPAAIYIYLCFASSDYPMIVAILQFAHVVIANTQFIKSGVFFIAPALVAIFVEDESNGSQWHIIFYITAASLIIANIVFCIYATDEPQPFTFIEEPKKETKHEELAGNA